ncbi:MAG TPA: trypsin-like peptidase domain-containing protein [Candidatus Saccharimonadales bacterium]|nr:trypsin-like peptidase domain-containing protein [Candidatus Saccharimonadales bacterium]
MSEQPHRQRNEDATVQRRLKAFVGICAALAFWPIIAVLVAYGLFFVVSVLLGFDVSSDLGSNIRIAQILAWMTVIAFAVFFLTWRKLRQNKHPGVIKLWFRRILLFYLCIGLLLGGGLSTGFYVSEVRADKTKTSKSTSCSVKSTLEQAEVATVPLKAENYRGTAYGTGFIVDSTGNIVTAYHVIKGASKVYISWSSGDVPVKVMKKSPAYDLAVLKMPSSKVPGSIGFSTSYDVPDSVYALGWPANAFFGGYATVSAGIVSRVIDGKYLHAADKSIPKGSQFIQTDTAINHGNSGGPLINKCGVVGVVDAFSGAEVYQGLPREEGISYAISSKVVKKVLRL